MFGICTMIKKIFSELDTEKTKMSALAAQKPVVKSGRRWADEAASADHGVFENVPIHQIICNTGRSFSKAKKTRCKLVGYAIADNLIDIFSSSTFTNPAHAVAAIISNAVDACSKSQAIGRFGVGFFSIFYFLANQANQLEVVTKSTASRYEYKLLVNTEKEHLVASLSRAQKKRAPGTTVTLRENQGFGVYFASMVETVSAFDQCTGPAIVCHGIQVNPKGDASNGTIKVTLETNLFSVEDTGVGMSLAEVQKLLMPRLPNEQMLASPLLTETPEVEVVHDQALLDNFFGIYVNRVLIKSIKFKGFEQGLKSMIFLPAATRLPISRDELLLSDASTVAFLKEAITKLIALHADRGSIVDLRKFVCQYAKESAQAFFLVQHFDQTVAESRFLLAPPKDPMVTFLTNYLKMQTVASEVFHSMKLENAILKQAKGKVSLNDGILLDRVVLYIPMFGRDYLISPDLCRIVVFRPDIPDEIISNFCNVDRHVSRNKTVQFQIDNLIEEKFDDKKMSNASLKKLFSTHNAQIRKTWFAHHALQLDRENVKDIFPNFLELCANVGIPNDIFSEALSTFQSKVVRFQIRADPYGAENLRFGVHDLQFTNDMKRYAEKKIKNQAITSLELSLIAFKLSIYPTLPDGELVVCFFKNQSRTSSFTELVGILLSNKVPKLIVQTIIEVAQQNTGHVVEAFLAVFIFCEFVADANIKGVQNFESDFCTYCMLHFITSVRTTVTLDTLLKLYTRAVAGAKHDAAVLRVMVIDPVMSSFEVLYGQPDEGFARIHKFAMSAVKEPEGVDIVEHEFTINELMAFVFDGNLEASWEFMDPETLQNLEKFVAKNKGLALTQAVAIDVNFGTTLDPVTDVIREWFERSAYELQQNGKGESGVQICVDLQHICTFDVVGIDRDDIMNLLLPLVIKYGVKSKRGGSDFLFAAMRQPNCDHVTVTTSSKDFWCEIVATPVLEGDLVVDVAVRMRSGNPVGERPQGTFVQLSTKETADQAAIAAQALLEVRSMYRFGDTTVYLNDEMIWSSTKQLLFDVPGVLSISVLKSETRKRSIVLVDASPYAQLMPFWESLFRPDDADQVWLSLFYTNVVISISRKQVRKRRRGKISFQDPEKIKFALQEAALWWKIFMYGEAQNNLDAFRNAIVPRSTAGAKSGQSQIVLTERWKKNSFPASIAEFRHGIYLVANMVVVRCAKEKDKNKLEYEHAQEYIAQFDILPIYKRAILAWFKPKKWKCERFNAGQEEMDNPTSAEDKASKMMDRDLGVLVAFSSTFVECINIALSKGHKIFRSETNTEINPLDTVPNFKSSGKTTAATAFYTKKTHTITINNSYKTSQACSGVLHICKQLKDRHELSLPAKADHLLEYLKQDENETLFHKRGSGKSGVFLHESFHAYSSIQGESGHPSLLLVDKDSGPVNTDGTYDAGIVAMYKWIIEAGFASKLFGKLAQLV